MPPQIETESLNQLSSDERLRAVEAIMEGCKHLYSKGKLQKEKLQKILPVFMDLAERDPFFLAHFTSYVMTKVDDKDIKLVSVFANSLNDADGTPLFPGSKAKKPNLRIVSQAAIQDRVFDAKMLERILEIANLKQPLGKRAHGTHLSKTLISAIEHYIRFREKTPKAMQGIRKGGMSRRMRNIYRILHLAPSYEAACILNWPSKRNKYWSAEEGKNVDGLPVTKKKFFDFSGLTDLQIAEKIRNDRLPVLSVTGALEDKMSPVIAVALLEQATGDQAIILRQMFDSQGLLKVPEVQKLFQEKISTAKTAFDRVDKINTEVDESVKRILQEGRSDARKKAMGTGFGKIFVHIDASKSMQQAIQLAMDYGSIIAECVPNPAENFFWGRFAANPTILQKPQNFKKEDFYAALYGTVAQGSTDMMACWDASRKLKCDVDIFITDCGHNVGPVVARINKYEHKPKVVGIVHINRPGYEVHDEAEFAIRKREFENAGIPVARIKPEALKESALVVQTLKLALVGKQALIDEIMAVPLLKLPEWYFSV